MIEKDLRVEKLIKDLRDIKIIIKNHFTQEFKDDLLYHKRNFIDLDALIAEEQIKKVQDPHPKTDRSHSYSHSHVHSL